MFTLVVFGEQTIPTSPSGIVITEGFPERSKIEGTTFITRLAAMEKKNLLLVGDSNGVIRLLTLNTLQEIKSFKAHDTEITQIIFPDDERFFFTTAKDKTVKQWDVQTYNLIYVYQGHESIVSHIDISPDGSKLVSMDRNLTAYYWNISSSSIMKTKIDFYEIDRNCKVNSKQVNECYPPPIASLPELEHLHDIKISKDGKRLIATYSYIIIFDLENMKKTETFYRYNRQSFGNLYRSKTVDKIYAAVNNNGIVIIDPSRIEYSILKFDIESSIAFDKNETKIIGVDYANAEQKRIRRFDINRFKKLPDLYRNEKDMLSNILLVNNQIILANRNILEFVSFDSGEVTKRTQLHLDNNQIDNKE